MITDADGRVINGFLTRDDKWRMKTGLDEISPLLRRTIVAKEDKYFYVHPGINPLAVGRALMHNLWRQKTTSGASTITMQVARAMEKRRRHLFAKGIEAFRALQLEWTYSKDEILQLYLNLVPYGGNIEGVKAASLLYFNKAPDHLSLAEITALSIIPNRPSSLVMGKHNDRIVQERNRWLRRFAASRLFTTKQIEDALAEPLTARRGTVPRLAPHLSYKLRQQATQPEVATSLVSNTQLKVEKLTEDYIRGLRSRNIRNAAVLVVDNRTNNVVAYVGSADFADTTDGGQVNGAAAVRQPGSTLKPLLYALCMDEGLLTPKTVIHDVSVNYEGYAPENYDQQFKGAVTMEYALAHSLNIPSVRSLRQLGKDKLVDNLVAAGFQQVKKDRRKLGLSMILGGCGATLEELTSLFAAFAQEGQWRPLLLTQKDKQVAPVPLVSAASAFLVTDILSQVDRPDFPVNWTATEHMPRIAWKTGTSYGRRDAWSIGYNKHFTVGVWVGNFSGAGVAELSGAETATPLLFKIFNSIDYNSQAQWYTPPAALALRQVCSISGLPPGEQCNNRISDYYLPLTSSTATCRHLQEVMLSADGRMEYCRSCAPPSGYSKKWVAVPAADLQQWYESQHLAFDKLPPHNPDCEKVFVDGGPAIVSPRRNAEYYINRLEPEPLQLAAQTGPDVSRLYWYIDDVLYKTTRPGEKQFFVPREGSVKISCTDDKGRNTNIRIHVRHVRL